MTHRPCFVFSYGSNMLLGRIKRRVASAAVVSTLRLPGWRLIFNKKSIDGSTKANIHQTESLTDEVWGVLHRLSSADKPILDQYEFLGKGYDLMDISTQLNIKDERVFAYVAQDIRYLAKDLPYDWYLQLVIAGAVENDFPSSYLDHLHSFKPKRDLDAKRRNDHLSLFNI